MNNPKPVPPAEVLVSATGERGLPTPEPAGRPEDVPSIQGSPIVPNANGAALPAGPLASSGPLGRPMPTPRPGNGQGPHGPSERSGGCTTAQLRRFIKSRAYVPIHEIRRRFLIAAEDDDVSGIDVGSGRVYVGLPEREGQMLGELLRGGEVGYELQLDPMAPVVIGVYPMRPVTRT